MALRTALYANADDVFLVWRSSAKIPNCLGFAIYRKRLDGAHAGQAFLLDNRVGFKADHPKQNEKRPSDVWPFQRFD